MGKKGPELKYIANNLPLQRAFADVVAMTGSRREAIKRLELTPAVYNCLNPNNSRYNEEFAAMVLEAELEYKDKIRQEIHRRAVEGDEQELVYKGEKTGDTIRVKSDSLLLAMAKANLPEYTDRQIVESRNVNMELGTQKLAELPPEARDMLRQLLDMSANTKKIAVDPATGDLLSVERVEPEE